MQSEKQKGKMRENLTETCGTPSYMPTYTQWEFQEEIEKEQKEYMKK